MHQFAPLYEKLNEHQTCSIIDGIDDELTADSSA